MIRPGDGEAVAASGPAPDHRLGEAAATSLRAGLQAALRARASPRSMGIFLFVILTLTALSIVPYWTMRRTELLRNRVDMVVEPALGLVTRLQLALAVQMAAGRGFLLTGEMEHLTRARAAMGAAQTIVDSLSPLVARISLAGVWRLGQIHRLGARWHEENGGLVPGALNRAEFLQRLPQQQQHFEELLSATIGLQREISRLGGALENDIVQSQRRGLTIAVALFLTALLAAAAVGWMFWRQRMLLAQMDWVRADAERHASEEHALRHAAAAVAAPITTSEVVRQIARGALAATRAAGAFMATLDDNAARLQVIAVAGAGTPPLGSSLVYPGSTAEMVMEKRSASIVTLPLQEPNGALAGSGTGSAVVVPLIDPDGPRGVLMLLYGDSRTPIGPDALARASTFGDLAAVAMRKARLLEESEQRQRELERMAESRALLLRGFSHDLKNPLWAADGFLQLLDLGVRGNLAPEQHDSVRHARRSLEAAFKLLQDLIDLARAGIGHIEVHSAASDIGDAVRDVVEEHRASAETKQIRVELRLEDVPAVDTDAVRVRQVLGNLLSNAIKYTPAKGRVIVGTRKRTEEENGRTCTWATAEVTDTGPGIRTEDQALVFQEFVRLDNSHDRPGAGIGLAISQRVAHALGGRITLQSEVGLGSTFTLWLPVEAPPA